MTEMRDCSIEQGRVFSQNNGRRVAIGGRQGILLHNQWIDAATGEHHQVGLDFRSDPRLAIADASPECQRLVREMFPELETTADWNVTDEYVQSLPQVYREILAVFPEVEPLRGSGDCLAMQTIYLALKEKYEFGEIRAACEQMAAGGAMTLRLRMFACPTALGEEIIARLTGERAAERTPIPAFSPPPAR